VATAVSKITNGPIGTDIFTNLEDLYRRRAQLPQSEVLVGNPQMGTPFFDLKAGFRDDGWVFLADLRDALSSKYSREQVDTALQQLLRANKIRVIPVAAVAILTKRDREAQLHFGGNGKDLVRIGPWH
jgi:hypothetical protein